MWISQPIWDTLQLIILSLASLCTATVTMAQALLTTPSRPLPTTTRTAAAAPTMHSNFVSFCRTTISPQVTGLRITCLRIGGVEIPNKKRVEVALQYIHGIGRTRSKQILNDLGFENKLTDSLSEDEIIALRDEVNKYTIEGDLRRFNALAIKRLKDIQCYRGRRHIMGLPCRGQ
ncbi:Small ribosomal subunit protein uS13c-like protein [Drosera capensis]